MNLGELYHYNSKIKFIPDLIKSGNLDCIEVYSVDNTLISGNSYKNISQSIKDLFIASYGKELQNSNIKTSNAIWIQIVSPVYGDNDTTFGSTEYQNLIIDWIRSGADLQELSHIINAGLTLSEIEDYVLYYGLSVLYTLNYNEPSANEESARSRKPDSAVSLSLQPEILIFSDKVLHPLFTNINSFVEEMSGDFKLLYNTIIKHISENNSIKLILLISDVDSKDLEHIQKRLPEGVIISSINFENSDSDYFDNIVKTTLGVRLT